MFEIKWTDTTRYPSVERSAQCSKREDAETLQRVLQQALFMRNVRLGEA